MVLGAILFFTAASYYAKRKGIPVEDVLSWSSCTCSRNTADQAVDDDALTEDYDLLLKRHSSSSSTRSVQSSVHSL